MSDTEHLIRTLEQIEADGQAQQMALVKILSAQGWSPEQGWITRFARLIRRRRR